YGIGFLGRLIPFDAEQEMRRDEDGLERELQRRLERRAALLRSVEERQEAIDLGGGHRAAEGLADELIEVLASRVAGGLLPVGPRRDQSAITDRVERFARRLEVLLHQHGRDEERVGVVVEPA